MVDGLAGMEERPLRAVEDETPARSRETRAQRETRFHVVVGSRQCERKASEAGGSTADVWNGLGRGVNALAFFVEVFDADAGTRESDFEESGGWRRGECEEG